MPDQTQGPKQLVLRKYPNRRYYDITRSRHVTLEGMHALIRDGYELQISDSKTGEDITPKVLAQIIIELDPPKLSVFPVALLHRLLRSNEQIVTDFVQRYFNQALTAFLDSQRSVEQYLRQAMGLQTPAPTVADWAKMLWGPFNPNLWSGQRPAGTEPPGAAAASVPPVAPPASAPASEEPSLRPLVDQLQRQIADLQEQLGRSRKSHPKRAD
jgi:polyhydroxyalkanoate synthesis repressor PhaR